MNKFYPIAVLLMAITFSISAQDIYKNSEADRIIRGTSLVKTNAGSKIPQHVIFARGNEVPLTGIKNWLVKNFDLDASFGLKQLSVEHDQLGMLHYRYQQLLNNVPVEGTMYLVHVKNGLVQSVSGVLYSNIKAATATVEVAVALQTAISYIGASHYRWDDDNATVGYLNSKWYPTGTLVYAPATGNANATGYKLAWRFDIYAVKPLSRDYVYVDAATGNVISKTTRLDDADVKGTAVTVYDGNKTITTDSYSGGYRLQEAGRGKGLQTFNLHTGTSYPAATDFTDADNYWNNVNASEDQYATDAHFAAEMTYDYYKTTYNRNSIDNSGVALISYVHYDVGFVNAFWDGTEMNYGDGDGVQYHPLTALDIGGHEITHGLTQYTAGLIEQNESGALNESFSDIFGNTIEGFARNGVINWNIAEDIGSPPFRSMSNPKLYKQPNTYQGVNWDFQTQEVHNNDGVQNYWYYLLVNGGTGTNDDNNKYNVTGIGITKAAAITFRSLTNYITPNSGYTDARYWSIQAATDLYGPCSNEVIQTTNAWYAVGVGKIFSDTIAAAFTVAPATSCGPPIKFTSQSINAGTYKWYFGDSLFSTDASPSHEYLKSGTYDVKLVIDGGSCGKDSTTEKKVITINLPIAPVVTGDSSCAPKSFTLSASSNGTPYWYSSSTGGTLLGTGTTFQTPVVSGNTTYYVEDQIMSAPANVGPANDGIGGGAGGYYGSNFPHYEIFNAYQPFTLISVTVYAQGAGNRTFSLTDSVGNVIHDTTINVANGTQVVNVNVHVPAGSSLEFGVLPAANLFRSTAGAVYPYTVPGVVSITGSNAGLSGYFYFCYNWKIQEQGCNSTRVPVEVKVKSTGVAVTPPGPINICKGQSVVISSSFANGNSWSNGIASSKDTITQSGTYFTSVTDSVCGVIQSNSVVVNAVNPPVPNFSDNVTGSTVLFSNSSTGATSTQWLFGDGKTSTSPSPLHIYPNQDSTYTVTLIVGNGTCSDTIRKKVTITSTGIETVSFGGLELYPNPTSGILIIKNYEPRPGDYIIFTDMTGRALLQQETTTRNTIDISNLPAGVYFAQLRTLAGNLNGKIVKTN